MINPMTYMKASLIGVGLVAIGGAMNHYVMAINGGRMPVFMDACIGRETEIINARHTCAFAGTHLAGLTDWISMGNWVYSPADFVISAGQIITLGAAVFFIAAHLIRLYKKS